MTAYTVIDPTIGDVIARHMTLAEAAHIILTDDGREYDIRRDALGWRLWSRHQVANKGWTETLVYSNETDRDAAEADIFAQVIAADWPRHPEAMTDEQFDRMRAELTEDSADA